MKENPYHPEQEEIKELLKQYNALKSGRKHSFLDEECFEKIIDHYDGKEEFAQALEAVETGMEQYPYSSVLLIRKADLLIATRKYYDALVVLVRASLLDANDINLYILKTDAYLALDQQEKAVVLLQEALGL
ncbi:MAG: tetratricopeptide repeat protein, partial [Chitinophagales bacterium]